jgi:hypothetical protein
MTPPMWLDAAGRRRPTRACWTCGREVEVMRFRREHQRPHGWAPPQTLHIRLVWLRGIRAGRAPLTVMAIGRIPGPAGHGRGAPRHHRIHRRVSTFSGTGR